MRIDLVLLSASLAGRCTAAEVDREARKKSPAGNKPSDHTAVVVELEEPGPGGDSSEPSKVSD